MNGLRVESFDRWMKAHGEASTRDDPRASADLFADNARYHENPFDEPFTGRDAIFQYWERGALALKDKTCTYEVLAVAGNVGIARWQSLFTVRQSAKRMSLDCLFVAEFDDQGKCVEFREWWHSKEMP
jgi:hypothetical protein